MTVFFLISFGLRGDWQNVCFNSQCTRKVLFHLRFYVDVNYFVNSF